MPMYKGFEREKVFLRKDVIFKEANDNEVRRLREHFFTKMIGGFKISSYLCNIILITNNKTKRV